MLTNSPWDPLCHARPRWRSFLMLLVVIALGLASRRFSNVLPGLLAESSGDALWTVALYLALAFIWPTAAPLRLVCLAIGISFAVETSQLISFAWLNRLREIPPVRWLLGTDFVWVDFPRYTVGGLLAVVLDTILVRLDRTRSRA